MEHRLQNDDDCACGHTCGCCNAEVKSECDRNGHIMSITSMTTGVPHCQRCGQYIQHSRMFGIVTAEVR